MDNIREFCEEWRKDYYDERPHRTLGYLPPTNSAEQGYQSRKILQSANQGQDNQGKSFNQANQGQDNQGKSFNQANQGQDNQGKSFNQANQGQD